MMEPNCNTKVISLRVSKELNSEDITRVKAKRKGEPESQEIQFEIERPNEDQENEGFLLSRGGKRANQVSAAMGKAPDPSADDTTAPYVTTTLQEEIQQTKSEFLAEVYKEILDAILKRTEDVSGNKATRNKSIQQYKSTIVYYENLEPFEKISVENAMTRIRSNLQQCKVCGHQTSGSATMSTHIMKYHMFQQSHVCPVCKITCSRNTELQMHMENSHIVPPIGSFFFVENIKTKQLSCTQFKEFQSGGLLNMTQLYFITWKRKREEVDEVVGISVDVTTYKDVKVAAKILWKTNQQAARNMNALADDTHGCSYRHLINDGWYFNSTEAIPCGIYGGDMAAGKTLKWFVRLVTDAECHNKPKSGFVRTVNCQDEILSVLNQILSVLPDKNRSFVINEEWKETR